MGADGGIVFLPLRSKGREAHDEVRDLLKPFYAVLDPNQGSFQEDACEEWFRANDLPKDCLVGYYGTHLDVSLDDLREILGAGDDLVSDAQLTFNELCLDIETRPYVTSNDGAIHYVRENGRVNRDVEPGRTYCLDGSQAFTRLDRWVIDQILWQWPNGADCLNPIAEMKVGDWARRLHHLVRHDSIYLVETWT